MFTIKRLDVPANFYLGLGTTNIIKNPNLRIRKRTRNVTQWKNGSKGVRRMVTAYLDAEEHFHRIGGCKEFWVLEAALHAFRKQSTLIW